MEKSTLTKLEVGQPTYQKGCFTKLKQIAGAVAIHGSHDHTVLKEKNVIPSWQISGPDSLVKVVPVIPHSDAETYPFSRNPISQWLINKPIRCRVVAFVPPGQIFSLFKGYV